MTAREREVMPMLVLALGFHPLMLLDRLTYTHHPLLARQSLGVAPEEEPMQLIIHSHPPTGETVPLTTRSFTVSRPLHPPRRSTIQVPLGEHRPPLLLVMLVVGVVVGALDPLRRQRRVHHHLGVGNRRGSGQLWRRRHQPQVLQ